MAGGSARVLSAVFPKGVLARATGECSASFSVSSVSGGARSVRQGKTAARASLEGSGAAMVRGDPHGQDMTAGASRETLKLPPRGPRSVL